MKKLIVIFAFLITLSCQKDEQIKPKSPEGSNQVATSNVAANKKIEARPMVELVVIPIGIFTEARPPHI